MAPPQGSRGCIFKACGAMTTPPWGVIIINKHRRYSKDTRFGSKPSSRCCDFGARTGDPPPPGGRGCIHIRIEVLITTAVWGSPGPRRCSGSSLTARLHAHIFPSEITCMASSKKNACSLTSIQGLHGRIFPSVFTFMVSSRKKACSLTNHLLGLLVFRELQGRS